MERNRCALAVAVLATVLVWGWSGGAAAAEIATVAKTGDEAPGAAGATFLRFNQPTVNGAGEVAFRAWLTGSGVTPQNDQGIWSGRPGALALVARKGEDAPGRSDAVFDVFSSPLLNGAGRVAFFAELAGSGVTPNNDAGIWAGTPGGLVLVAREGDDVSVSGGPVFDRLSFPRLNGAGEVAFDATLAGPGVTPDTNEANFVGRRSTRRVLGVRSGDRAPGSRGAAFGSLGTPQLNGVRQLAFSAGLAGSGVTADNDEGVWVGAPGQITLAARKGDLAPGAGGAVFSDFFTIPKLNGTGAVALLVDLSGGGEGIWAGKPGGLALVARSGDRAPGAGGAVFDSFGLPELNGAGEVAFEGILGGGGEGIWAGMPGGLALVFKTGDPAPGTGGQTFTGPRRSPSLNGAGEVAFEGSLSGGGGGIWAGPPGGLRLVAREGDVIEVAASDPRTVADISFTANTGNEEGQMSGFSEGGQLAFWAAFTDGSDGIFLSPPDAPTVHRMPNRAISGPGYNVMLPRSFEKPVIIAGPPGFENTQPGVVRLRRIEGRQGFVEARFQEWRYLDGKHPEERADFLVMEQGRKRQADGSIWEAGTVKVAGNRRWKQARFAKRYPGVPRVFATVQSFKGRTPVAARVRNVTRTGFEVSIQEEEKDLAGGHPKETVGYLAIHSKKGKGRIAGGVNGTKYRLRQAKVDHRFKKVLGERIKLEEEMSQDRETNHKKETASVMALGRGLFAQQASDRENDTTAMRRR